MKTSVKSTVVAIIAALSLFLYSCGSSPVDQAEKILDDAIAKIEKANDVYELVGIANTMKSDLNVFNASNKDYKPTEQETKRIQAKLNEFQRVYLNKTMELSYGDTPEGEAAKEVVNKMLPQ